MPKPGQKYGPAHDPRFTLHGRQPRGGKLDGRQYRLCLSDPAYAAALRPRVTDPSRWAAFLAGRVQYAGRPCHRCGSTSRRVRDAGCYACLLSTNRGDWQKLRAGVMPLAERTRAGLEAIREQQRREAAGEYAEAVYGPFTARSYPTGRLALVAPSLSINQHDLASLPASQIVSLCRRYPDLRDVLAWAGWSVPA